MALQAGPSSVHTPSEPHTSGWAALHRRVCGVHTPLHALPLQTKGQLEVSCQVPFSSHVCKFDAP
jgi:hypothetical protein